MAFSLNRYEPRPLKGQKNSENLMSEVLTIFSVSCLGKKRSSENDGGY